MMTIFAMFSKPDAGPEAIAAVPERFVWSAFLFTPFWALANRAWGFFALWFLVLLALVLGHRFIGADAGLLLYGVFALWSGFAASENQARALQSSGWLAHGDLSAPDQTTAEALWLQRFYGARN